MLLFFQKRSAFLPLLLLTSPAAAAWDRYEIILWHTGSAAQLDGARRLGVTAGRIFGDRDAADPAPALAAAAAPLRAAGLGVYVENIATDWYASYHRWQPGRSLTWRFAEAQARLRSDRADPAAFRREPGLSDPAWRARIAARLAAHARAVPDALFFDLADEAGIADLTAAWDFDIAPESLAGFREWLRGQYGTLAALNAEWGSGFADWAAVQPKLTDAALRATDGNFAAWADFKAWMDVAFAAALRAGRDALHAADPAARAGLEGAQMPGWGGYDYGLLAAAVDVMEVTEAGGAFDIAHALDPALVLLSTNYAGDPAGRQALWRAAFAGGRGVILWDPDGEVVRPDGTPGPRGLSLAPLFAALGGPAGRALLAAVPLRDPVVVLYSPASFRIEWLLARQRDAAAGRDWSARQSETELEDTPGRAALRQTLDVLAHRGLTPRFVTPAQLAQGVGAARVLILPHTLALSDAEIAAVQGFAAAGGVVLADIPPGDYDQHGRRRAGPLRAGVTLLPEMEALADHLAVAGLPGLADGDGAPVRDVTARRLREPDGHVLLAVLRDLPAGTDRTPETVRLARTPLRDLLHPERPASASVSLPAGEPALMELP